MYVILSNINIGKISKLSPSASEIRFLVFQKKKSFFLEKKLALFHGSIAQKAIYLLLAGKLFSGFTNTVKNILLKAYLSLKR